MIDMRIVDFTPLETRIALLGRFADDMSPQMQEIGEMLLESNWMNLDAGGRPSPFAATRSGRLPLGGRGGKIGQSERISEITANSVTLEAGGQPFNAIHQFGGIIQFIPTKKQLGYFWAVIAPRLGIVPQKRSALPGVPAAVQRIWKINIPARRYFRIQNEDVIKAKEILAKAITK